MEAGVDECDTMFVDFILWLMERSAWSPKTVHFNTAMWPDHDGIFIAAMRLLRKNTHRSGYFRRSFLPMHHGYERHKHFYAALFFLPQKNVYINFGLNSHFFLGSHFTMMVGIFSYMADITKESNRTVRIGIISLTYSVGVPFGMAFSGILLK